MSDLPTALVPLNPIPILVILLTLMSALSGLWIRVLQKRRNILHEQLRLKTALMGEQQHTINYLQAMVDGVSVPLWCRDANLNLMDCNQAYAQMVESPKSTALAQQLELTQPSPRAYNITTETPSHTASFYTIIHGQRHYLEITERLHNQVRIGFALDKSEQEALGHTLQEHIASQNSLVENLSTAVAVFDRSTRLKFFNRAYVRMWQCDEAWLRTQPTLGEILEDLRARRQLPEHADFAAYKRQCLSQFTSLLSEPEEELVHRPDGLTWRMVTAPYPLGGLMYMFEDISDKLSLERQHNTLVAVKREAFNNLYEGIVIFGSDHRLKIMNPAFIKIWGLPEQSSDPTNHLNDLINSMADKFVSAQECEHYRHLFTSTFIERHPSWGRIHCREGQVIDFKYVPLPDGAHLLGFIDATDQYKVEQALRERNHALIAADELKSQFIMHVSYELRTPLNTILGFTEILQQEYFGTLTPKQAEYLEGVHQSSQQLLKLINNILDITTIESEQFTLEIDEVDIPNVLQDLDALMNKRAYDSGIALVIDCPADIGKCYMDERRIRQVLYNLIINALQHTPSGGKITVYARRLEAEIALSVSDNGMGIASQDHERIFKKFERSAKSTTIGGPGLGLALVKSIIDRHRGRVTVESEPGIGTTITCYIPY